MASPLILKIQAQLEKRGFDDVKRQIDRLKEALGGLRDNFREIEKASGGFLGGAVNAFVIATTALTIAGIQQERATARLTNSFAGLDIDADNAAIAIQRLSAEMAENSLFSRGQFRDSLAIIVRGTRNLTFAQQDALQAQELALQNNVSLEQASKALSLALQGEGRQLSALIELSEREIETLRERGELRTELARIAPIGEATGREIDTISGALDNFTVRAASRFTELGEVVLERFTGPAINFAIGFIEGVGDAFEETFDQIVFGERLAEEEAAAFNTRLNAINSALNLTQRIGQGAFTSIQEEIGNLDVAIQFLTTGIGELNAGQQEVLEGAIRQRAELIESQRLQRAISQTTLRDEIRVFQALSLTREDFQRQELNDERRQLENLLQINEGNQERQRIILQRITNNKLAALRLEQNVVLDNIKEETDVRRQLFSLLQGPAAAIDETTSIEERGRALDRLVQSRKEALALVEQERISALTSLRIETDRDNLTERQILNRERLIEAETIANRLSIEQGFLAGATEIGPLDSRSDQRERAEGRIETILRKQTTLRNTQTRAISQETILTKERERLERDIQILSKKSGEEVGLQLARLTQRKNELDERLKDTIIPTSEGAIEDLVTEIERQLDIPDININLNVDRLTILEDMRTVLDELLEARGFSINRKDVAPAGEAALDATPGL